ncbi:NIPSNAP family protein [Aquisphaera insulae]|uniref:NIPSNAP family protein n=1 Tax=Aquisphaera insulae TaxID=2712864 RepID=UPI0013E9A207|nr:NIPSNAP family protein [Aquisphaera insulae]
MTTRREILAAMGGVGLAATWSEAHAAPAKADAKDESARDLYELRRYHVETDEQKSGLDAYLRDAAIPALNRLGVSPVGVFYPEDKALKVVYALLRHKTADSLLTTGHKLQADADYLKAGASFLDAPAEKPAYKRVESSVLYAFKGMPEIETPPKSAGRILQLRIYESPSVKTNLKKIEMFNDAGEIPLFRKVGLHPVFFGQAIFGDKLPNLTYMLAFESHAELDANWKKFVESPEWQALKGRAEYSDKKILSGITNIVLTPAEYSQV